ncbi:MAG: helix-turn-helix transcriptional regulator [Dehalococcoidia bacterium]|nr:helix-turn-helix transcriptional regulator [Dehalococcoidia bacterium]
MVTTRDNVLTKRERDILALVGRGMTNQEIGDQLYISARTVKCTLHRACVKMGVRTRDQAVIRALRRRAIDIRDIFSLDELAELLSSLSPELITKVAQRVEQNIRTREMALGTEWLPRFKSEP